MTGLAHELADAALFDQRGFRDALGCFATGVTIVTTRASDGAPIGMTVSSFSSVSLDPPLILFSVRKAAFSLSAFERADRFAVHMLSADQGELSNRFARASGEKWNGVDHEHADTGCVLIGGPRDLRMRAPCDRRWRRSPHLSRARAALLPCRGG